MANLHTDMAYVYTQHHPQIWHTLIQTWHMYTHHTDITYMRGTPSHTWHTLTQTWHMYEYQTGMAHPHTDIQIR